MFRIFFKLSKAENPWGGGDFFMLTCSLEDFFAKRGGGPSVQSLLAGYAMPLTWNRFCWQEWSMMGKRGLETGTTASGS